MDRFRIITKPKNLIFGPYVFITLMIYSSDMVQKVDRRSRKSISCSYGYIIYRSPYLKRIYQLIKSIIMEF